MIPWFRPHIARTHHDGAPMRKGALLACKRNIFSKRLEHQLTLAPPHPLAST